MGTFTQEMRDKAAAVRKKNAEERAQRQLMAGIPESRRFGGSPEAENNPILDCHVGGMLVRDLPDEMKYRIAYQQTDEGIAENNKGKSPHRISVTTDEFSNKLNQRSDDLKKEMQPWEAADPLRELADKHIQPGMKARFLSPTRMAKAGTRGFEVVKDERGDPVKVRNLVLGQMPESDVKRRNQYYREQGNKLLGQVEQQFVSQQKGGGSRAVTDEV